MPPARQRLASPYDDQARYASKRTTTWTGYTVHLTESCDDEAVHLIPDVETTLAPATAMEMTAPIQQALVDKDVAPTEHLIDAGYVDAHVLVTAQSKQGSRGVGPVQPDRQWPAQREGGYDITAFTIDWANHAVTCPQGQMSTAWLPHQDRYGNNVITVKFARPPCLDCPAVTCVPKPRSSGAVSLGILKRTMRHSKPLVRLKRQTNGKPPTMLGSGLKAPSRKAGAPLSYASRAMGGSPKPTANTS